MDEQKRISSLQMLQDLIPNALDEPRHEGYFTGGNESDAEMGIELQEKLKYLHEVSAKRPEYIERLISSRGNFPIKETHDAFAGGKVPGREELLNLNKLGWGDGAWFLEGDKFEDMPTEDLRGVSRNYAGVDIDRAYDQVKLDEHNADMNDLISGRRKPRSIDELRLLAKEPPANKTEKLPIRHR